MGWPEFSRAFGRRARRDPHGPLREYYAHTPPGPNTPLAELPLLSVDIETTGLDPARDHILSMGWVPLDGPRILLGQARHLLIHEGAEVGQSATIHGLTDQRLEREGVSLEEALAQLLAALAGRAMLVHYAPIERNFLSAATRRSYGSGLKVPIVDTMALEQRQFERRSLAPRGEDLRLGRVRERYGLPKYRAHDAVTDALATAELFLAMCATVNAGTLRGMQVK